MQERAFVPETEHISLQGTNLCSTPMPESCPKSSSHDQYTPIAQLNIDHLPDKWKNENVLADLKLVARRVVQLTVLKLSPARRQRSDGGGAQTGSGFITFHPVHGIVINTSKHVVYDPYEARHTIVKLFYNEDSDLQTILAENKLRDLILNQVSPEFSLPPQFLQAHTKNGLFLSRGSDHHFKSVMCSDFTSFTCKLPLHELFSQEEIQRSNAAFSWRNFSLRRLILSSDLDMDVAVISHPHGCPKAVSFGKMKRVINLSPSLYDAITCGGSSGAPITRLYSDSRHYISAGQFVHHGHNKQVLDLGMGTVRPPIILPYWKPLDTENSLLSAVNILYEPIFYWTLVICDLLHIESTLHSSIDVFAYTSSFSALLLTMDSVLFKVLFLGYWLHILFSFVLHAKQSGFIYAILTTVRTLLSMSMFMVAWTVLYLLPWTWTSDLIVCLVWFVVLYVERHWCISARFMSNTLGSFPQWLKYRLAIQYGEMAKRAKRNNLVTTEKTKNG